MLQAVIPVGVDYAQLLEDVRAVIRHELIHTVPAPKEANTGAEDELLSIREAATMLGVTVQTVHEWKRLGRLKYHKLGSRSYLKRADILSALQSYQRTQKGR